ncbi:tail fiber domain-containing protein [Cellulosimicrobium marinum]|uniref:tail fiber domain-containing protein n=1 Tax=Cellulosimicrobium marinum TaxID=1638992 RepID=UPI001E3B164E|nr:tail fiber domain-containing protein [Cellulosimicrobium marinum]MCB7135364.1 tail fiber domain-containing protein [Cellulosimicrobium marinum]
MANGDAAAAAGMDVVPGTADARQGYDEINKTRDYLADHETNGTHAWSKITGKPTTYPSDWDTMVDKPTLSSSADGYTIMTRNAVGQTAVADPTSASHAANRQYVEDRVDDVQAWANGRFLTSVPSSDADKVTSAAYGREAGASRYAMWMDGDRNIGRATSSRRYKSEIEPHDIDPAVVLALQPVTYQHKNDPVGVREFGLIAEDVHDAGMPEVVTWYADQIDGIRYDLLAVSLLSVVKSQDAQIKALATRLEALESPTPTTPEEG